MCKECDSGEVEDVGPLGIALDASQKTTSGSNGCSVGRFFSEG